ncbi:MAG: DNA replication and repair protein RecF [Pelovirga sp.]
MVVKKIEIKDFRNISYVNFEPSKNKNFIIGDNAQGKTNLIESIYFLVFGKSFRTNNLTNLLDGKKKSYLKFLLSHNNVQYNIEVQIDKEKRIEINGKRSRIKDISNLLKVILYYPSEINFLLKNPSLRRNLIDKSIYLTDVDYSDLHLDYLKCLKNRNICLKENKDSYIWKEKLIDLSYQIVKKRINHINEINSILYKYNGLIEGENYKIDYKKIDLTTYKDKLRIDFKKIEKKEEKVGHTLLGQHTDSVTLSINNIDLDITGSEGQKKSFLIFLKFAQAVNLKNKKDFKPLFIIDDINSELDNKRQNVLIENLLNYCDQSFITSLNIPSFYKEKDKIFYVTNGNIFENKENS